MTDLDKNDIFTCGMYSGFIVFATTWFTTKFHIINFDSPYGPGRTFIRGSHVTDGTSVKN